MTVIRACNEEDVPVSEHQQTLYQFKLTFATIERKMSMSVPEKGSEGTAELIVNKENTALAVGSGSLEVLATPAVAALMEKAACIALEPFMEENITTVGTLLSIEHISASPVGAEVTAKATLTLAEGRRFCFEVIAFDNAGVIAKGTHERFSVKKEGFVKKAEAKLRAVKEEKE